MKYLITGGAGFIGSHLTESLLADGNAVTVIDDFSTGSAENLAAVRDHRNLTVIEEDILTGDSLEHAVGQCDCVIHLAAAVGGYRRLVMMVLPVDAVCPARSRQRRDVSV